jgi:hypothetical protein
VNDKTKLLEIEKSKKPMGYPAAMELATKSATSDSENFRRRTSFRSSGTGIGEQADNTHLYNFTVESTKKTAP